jgi:hypothetical protein
MSKYSKPNRENLSNRWNIGLLRSGLSLSLTSLIDYFSDLSNLSTLVGEPSNCYYVCALERGEIFSSSNNYKYNESSSFIISAKILSSSFPVELLLIISIDLRILPIEKICNDLI